MSRMWFWGESSRGVFGPKASSTPVSWTVPRDVVKVVCGEQHVVLLREDGTLLSHGSNSRRQLGRRTSNNEKAGNVEGLPFVVGVACGQYHSLAVSLAGIVYSWGENEDGQLGVLPDPTCDYQHAIPVQLPTKTVQVACGDFHSVALTKGGDVLSWGSNSHGQLGVGRQVSLQYLPLLLYPLNGVPVTQISAGASHTLFLTLSGLVYCCGANNHGQLGLNRVDPNGRFNICIVPALRRLSIAFIACGENHSAVLTKEGEVYTFGEGADGQLGHGSFTDEVMPKLVVGMDERASQVVCGRRHTLVLGSSGKLWAFGNGVKGQLGTGKAETSATPTLVQLPSSSDCTDLRIAAGWNSSFASAGPRGLEQKQITGRLDEAKLRKWLALKKCTPEAEREISEMFLSNSSLVASFTKVTGLSREAGALNIDLDAASRTFSQMLAVPWLRKKLDLKNCMEILVKSGPNLRSPEIIVVLLACPLFQEVAHVLNLVLPMAVVIKDMCEKCHTTLKGWWSAMSAATLLTHILLFKNALAFAIKSDLLESHAPGVEGVLAVLKLLYKVNKRMKPHKVPLDTFYVEEIDESHLMVDILFWLSLHHREVAYCFSEDRRSRRPIFCQYPFLLSLHSKTMAFVLIAGALQRIHSGLPPVLDFFQLQGPKPPVLKLSLRPSHLLEDTFRQLSTVDHGDFRKALVVIRNKRVDHNGLELLSPENTRLSKYQPS
ncbi:probable E3 ubiquitin-protein ligase HERC4 isoform X2 [Nerophis ophidion]|uniref:probable E3 ubiquitin-protein ligase HERC4 isoform X2 n=1 Tax=Nerophis ophidion TaxID=159077 RepID=UPI002AE0776E|nr:probable E3 ubiquitin-protein ligase HERC4 isoform X2 [Nerophis ophidion]